MLAAAAAQDIGGTCSLFKRTAHAAVVTQRRKSVDKNRDEKKKVRSAFPDVEKFRHSYCLSRQSTLSALETECLSRYGPIQMARRFSWRDFSHCFWLSATPRCTYQVKTGGCLGALIKCQSVANEKWSLRSVLMWLPAGYGSQAAPAFQQVMEL